MLLFLIYWRLVCPTKLYIWQIRQWRYQEHNDKLQKYRWGNWKHDDGNSKVLINVGLHSNFDNVIRLIGDNELLEAKSERKREEMWRGTIMRYVISEISNWGWRRSKRRTRLHDNTSTSICRWGCVQGSFLCWTLFDLGETMLEYLSWKKIKLDIIIEKTSHSPTLTFFFALVSIQAALFSLANSWASFGSTCRLEWKWAMLKQVKWRDSQVV